MARIRKSSQSTVSSKPINSFWYIAAYIRLSREDGNDESLSVTNQKKIIGEYLETYFQGNFTLVDYYIDDGVTGTDYDRPSFQRMLHDIETGTINCVICKNLSRMFRNYSDQGYFLEKIFPMHKTRFITVSDPKIDSYLHPEALLGLEIPINGLMNDRFAAKTSFDVRATFATKRRKGEFIGAFAPYGYKKASENKNALVIDEEAAKVVQTIFQWFVYEGMSKNGIARRLNELGIVNPTAYKKSKGLNFSCPHTGKNDGLWSPGSVSSILKNQMYTGTMVQGKQTVINYKVHHKVPVPETDWYIVPNTHEPIIEQALFTKAAGLQIKDTRTAPGEQNLYLLSGLILCADCKKSMTRQKSKNMVYYYCRTFRDKSKNACTKHAVKETLVVSTVLTVIQTLISLIDSTKVIEKILQAPVKQTESSCLATRLHLRQKELEKVTDIVDGLYDDWKNGHISKEEYHRLKAKYSSQTEHLQIMIKRLQSECSQIAERDSENDPFLSHFLQYQNIGELNRGILVTLVKNLYIHQNGGITIEFNFSDPYCQIIL